MKAAFHYLVKAKVIRQTENNELDFVEINKVFENENPIIARTEAFSFYQSWIDVLLQKKDKEYVSDRQARRDLVSFIEPGANIKLVAGGKEIEFDNKSYGNGIGVYFIIDNGDETLIHGIGNFGGISTHHDIFFNLVDEFEYYRSYNYETKNTEEKITYCVKDAWEDDCRDIAIVTKEILKTPFDWSGYDKPYWWQETYDQRVESAPKTIQQIIHEGEQNTVEFKSTLHFKTGREINKIKEDIPKTICAFLNSNGGLLFIGVDDNKSIIGLDFDFNLSNGKNSEDYFRLKFDNMMEQFIGLSIKNNINAKFYKLEDKSIFVVIVSPSKKRLVFHRGKEGKELYVRGEASTLQIKDAEEIINCWKEKQVD
ncbi:MAG: ATP-binding protein [Parafilimonas sp.]